MNLIPTRLSPCATVLLVMALVSLTVSCHKKGSQLGTEDAAVAHATATPKAADAVTAVKDNPRVDATSSVASVSRAREKHDRDRDQRSASDEAKRTSEEVAATRESVSADPAELVARANLLLDRAKVADTPRPRAYGLLLGDAYIAVAPTHSSAANYGAAADTAQNAIDLLKSQAVPTDIAPKQKYSETLLAALSVRATALGLLAAHDHAEAGRAEIAYDEYLAAESDEAKRARAEYDLATMFYKVEQFERAKTAFERLLTKDANDRRALMALAGIHEKLAAAETAAGDTAKAQADLVSAKQYTERLLDVNTRSKIDYGDATNITASSADEAERDRFESNRANQGVNYKSRKRVQRKPASKPPNAARRSAERP